MSMHYSLEYLKSISGGDNGFVDDMIQTFVNSVPEELNKIGKSIHEANWRKVGEEAHKFGSTLMYLELEDLKKIILSIETYGLEMEHTEEIPVLFKKLSEGCYQIINQLKNDFDYLNH